jgi:1-acyl-sn-glycerol-3-phosphate acyltransferase
MEASAVIRGIAQALAAEVHPGRKGPVHLNASLEVDWGFDSLTRAELLLRTERAFAVHLPDSVLGEAESLADILTAVERGKGATAFGRIVPSAPAQPMEGSEPGEAVTLTEVLDWHAGSHGDRCHLVIWSGGSGDVQLTYRDLRDRSRSVARCLRDAGLEPGERVAIMLPSGRDFFETFFGVLYAGCVPVPIYPPSRPSQIGEHLSRQAKILDNAQAAFLVGGSSGPDVARLLGAQIPFLRGVLTVGQLQGGSSSLPALLNTGDACLIQYTSGSTGDPKGVLLSHANVLANIRAMGNAMNASASDVFVSWLPLYHDMGLIGAWLGSLYFAAPLVVMSPLTFLVRPAQWLWAIHSHKGTLSAAPNFAFELCVRKIQDDEIEGLDLSSLRMIANGSEAVSPSTMRRFEERFSRYGFRPEAMAPVYGLAESAVGLAFPPLGRRPVVDRIDRDIFAKTGRAIPVANETERALEFVGCGHALPGHEIRIVDAAGEVGERQQGQLEFRGPSATAAYFRNPGKTKDLFHADWLRSGDLAYVAAGELFVTGRSKDIVIRAGRHIFPDEVEAAVGEIPGVRKGCVVLFGSHDARAGTERVIIVAETVEEDESRRTELIHRVGEAAAILIGAPADEIVLVPPRSIPKTSSGKLRRAAAQALHQSGALGRRPLPVWRQLAGLASGAVVSALLRALSAAAALAHAARWWTMLVVFAVPAWPLVVLLPRPNLRWIVLHRLATWALRLMGVPLSVEGGRGPFSAELIAATHSSYLDGLVLVAAFPGPLRFVAKKELEGQMVAGPFLRALGAVFVERADPVSGVADIRRIVDEVGPGGGPLVFFPEGTFTRAPGLLPFRTGAFLAACELGRPVVPVVIAGTRAVLRADQWFPRRGSVRVVQLEAIAPDGKDFTAAIRLRDRVRAAILMQGSEPDVDA